MRTARASTTQHPPTGLRVNAAQFALLVAVNALVGAMVGIERSVLPVLAAERFRIASATVTLSFLVAFGIVKASMNLLAGSLADRRGRKHLLVIGWAAALPIPLIAIWAPSWGWIVFANVLLGINQGFAWSMTVVMKIDLVGERRRGLALGFNEAAGYAAVAVAAYAAAALASAHGPRVAPFLLAAGIAFTGFCVSLFAVRETHHFVRRDGQQRASLRAAFSLVTWRDPSLSTAAQAGLVNNLNDAMAWGLLPLVLTARAIPLHQIGVVAAAYPLTWGLTQLGTGALSDRIGRKPPIAAGMFLQAVAIGYLALTTTFAPALAAAIAMGLGTALVYPALLAVIGDVAAPASRATALGVYRFWRDLGYAVGALLAGAVADAFGPRASMSTIAVVTAASGLVVVIRMRETHAHRSG